MSEYSNRAIDVTADVDDKESVDVVVIGGGIAGMVAALECAKVGLRVRIIEAEDRLGGAIRPLTLKHIAAGSKKEETIVVDAGAESFATRGGAVRSLAEELGIADDIVAPAVTGAWLAFTGPNGLITTVPMPKTGVLGIPSSPLATDVRNVIGWRGSLRAYADRLIPLLRIGKAESVGELVRTRMGKRVLDGLVRPIAGGVYSADPELLAVDSVAPGLNKAMTRAGSLSGGVGLLSAERPAGSAIEGLRGGMHTLIAALEEHLKNYKVSVCTGFQVDGFEQVISSNSDISWRVHSINLGGPDCKGRECNGLAHTAEGHRGERRGDCTGDCTGERSYFNARHIVLATSAREARRLLGGVVEDFVLQDWPEPNPVTLLTLHLKCDALNSSPRGTGLVVTEGTSGVVAKALTHMSAKWHHLIKALPSGEHVIRLSYQRPGETDPFAGLADDEVADLALADASALLGVKLDAENLLDISRTLWAEQLAPTTIGHYARVQALDETLAPIPTLAVTGAWLAGTGLASIIPHATKTALRIRRHALGLTE